MPAPPESDEILELYRSAADLVGLLARQVRRAVGSGVGVAELESCGNEGLLDAAHRYDTSKGVPFRCYAKVRIRGAIIDGVRAIMPLPRRTFEKLRSLQAMDRISASFAEDFNAILPEQANLADEALADHLAALATSMAIGMIAQSMAGDASAPVPSEELEDPEQASMRAELGQQIERAIQELPREEATIVRRHYIEGERFDQVAAELGLSKSWASRLHRRAMSRLEKRLRAFR